MVHSVLENVRKKDVLYYPYPHIVIENCLPDDYYRELEKAYPDDDLILELNKWRHKGKIRQNRRHDISAHKALEFEDRLSPVWIDFIRYHTSQVFYNEVLELLGPEIKTTYPDIENRLGKNLSDCVTGIRLDPNTDLGEISMDCQVGINTSVTRQNSVRRVHTDAPEELFAMLLYFRREQDDSTGGNLELYKWKEGIKRLFRRHEVDEKDAEFVGRVSYRANTLVCFINSESSLHAVSERSITPYSRRLVNIIGEVYRSIPEGLFVKPQKRKKTKIERWFTRLSKNK